MFDWNNVFNTQAASSQANSFPTQPNIKLSQCVDALQIFFIFFILISCHMLASSPNSPKHCHFMAAVIWTNEKNDMSVYKDVWITKKISLPHFDQHILKIRWSNRNQIWAMRMESGRKWKPARPIVNGWDNCHFKSSLFVSIYSGEMILKAVIHERKWYHFLRLWLAFPRDQFGIFLIKSHESRDVLKHASANLFLPQSRRPFEPNLSVSHGGNV